MEKLQEKIVLRYFKAHPHKNPGKSIKTSHNFCIINDRGLLYTLGGLRTTALRNPGGVSEIESSVNENPVGVDSGTGFPKISRVFRKLQINRFKEFICLHSDENIYEEDRRKSEISTFTSSSETRHLLMY